MLGARAILPLGLRNAVTKPPKRFGLALVGGNNRILDEAGLQRRSKRPPKLLFRAGCCRRCGRFNKNVPLVSIGKRSARARQMGKNKVECGPWYEFEAFHRIAEGAFQQP